MNRVLLATTVVVAAGVLWVARRTGPADAAAGMLEVPAVVQISFQRFADIEGTRLLDELYRLGYHGGFPWEDKGAPRRPTLTARTIPQTEVDTVRGVTEGTMMLDLHHDSMPGLPPTITLRFAQLRADAQWTLLLTDGFPVDPQKDLRLDSIQKLEPELHAAIAAAFPAQREAVEFWKAVESGAMPKPAPMDTLQPTP